MSKDEKDEKENPLFTKLAVPISAITIKSRRRARGSYYVQILEDFMLVFDEDKWVVQYLGDSKKLSGVVATLRKIAIKKNFSVKTEFGLLADGKQVIILTKDKVPEYHPRREQSKNK